MKRIVLMAAAVLCLLALPAQAADVMAGKLKISAPWARATPKGAAVGGGYMTITNMGTEPDRLIGGSTGVASQFRSPRNEDGQRHHEDAAGRQRPRDQAGPDRRRSSPAAFTSCSSA